MIALPTKRATGPRAIAAAGEVNAYAADAVAMNPLQPSTEEEIERLRALGYAD